MGWLIPEGDPRQAVRVRRLLELLHQQKELAERGGWRFTVSIGVTAYAPREELASVLGRADRALYKAKPAGRNCTRSADPPLGPQPVVGDPEAGGQERVSP
ncbi:MAG TPA: diguanylate cyclase [Gammaproteobacteria bacterium]|nr:diguanylate cyclase [Gammaproteobacteria bacterium]